MMQISSTNNTNPSASRDWIQIAIHAFCGALLGAVIGLGFYLSWCDSGSKAGAMASIGGGALILGTLCGVLLDRFWQWLGKVGHWIRAVFPWPF